MNKVVKITKCEAKLRFVKAIMANTKKGLYESKVIADQLMMPKFVDGEYKMVFGTLLLNESSISEEQWLNIVQEMENIGEPIEWHYVEQDS